MEVITINTKNMEGESRTPEPVEAKKESNFPKVEEWVSSLEIMDKDETDEFFKLVERRRTRRLTEQEQRKLNEGYRKRQALHIRKNLPRYLQELSPDGESLTIDLLLGKPEGVKNLPSYKAGIEIAKFHKSPELAKQVLAAIKECNLTVLAAALSALRCKKGEPYYNTRLMDERERWLQTQKEEDYVSKEVQGLLEKHYYETPVAWTQNDEDEYLAYLVDDKYIEDLIDELESFGSSFRGPFHENRTWEGLIATNNEG